MIDSMKFNPTQLFWTNRPAQTLTQIKIMFNSIRQLFSGDKTISFPGLKNLAIGMIWLIVASVGLLLALSAAPYFTPQVISLVAFREDHVVSLITTIVNAYNKMVIDLIPETPSPLQKAIRNASLLLVFCATAFLCTYFAIIQPISYLDLLLITNIVNQSSSIWISTTLVAATLTFNPLRALEEKSLTIAYLAKSLPQAIIMTHAGLIARFMLDALDMKDFTLEVQSERIELGHCLYAISTLFIVQLIPEHHYVSLLRGILQLKSYIAAVEFASYFAKQSREELLPRHTSVLDDGKNATADEILLSTEAMTRRRSSFASRVDEHETSVVIYSPNI